MRKPVADTNSCSATEDGQRLKISDLESRGIAKNKVADQLCGSASLLVLTASFLMMQLNCCGKNTHIMPSALTEIMAQ